MNGVISNKMLELMGKHMTQSAMDPESIANEVVKELKNDFTEGEIIFIWSAIKELASCMQKEELGMNYYC